MNERIKKLAEQPDPVATIGNWGRVEWANNVYPQLGDRMYAAVDLEKFAELIVRECASICLDMKYTNPQPHHYSVMIKEHFGVE